jgi:hypothetical protein
MMKDLSKTDKVLTKLVLWATEISWISYSPEYESVFLLREIDLFPPDNPNWVVGWLKSLDRLHEGDPNILKFLIQLRLFLDTKDDKWHDKTEPLLNTWRKRFITVPQTVSETVPSTVSAIRSLNPYTKSVDVTVTLTPPQEKTVANAPLKMKTKIRTEEPEPDLSLTATMAGVSLAVATQQWTRWKSIVGGSYDVNGFVALLQEVAKKEKARP